MRISSPGTETCVISTSPGGASSTALAVGAAGGGGSGGSGAGRLLLASRSPFLFHHL